MYMKKQLTLLWVLLAVHTLTPLVFAEPIYRWVDENGKQHFSDKNPALTESEKFNTLDIPSIKTVKSKSTKKLKRNKRQNKTAKRVAGESKASRCNKLKTDIASIESKLKTRLLADKSAQYSKKLTDLRWKRLKTC